MFEIKNQINLFKNKSVLVTGGTGSFGNAFTNYVLNNLAPSRLIIFSRDENKQFEMSKVKDKSIGT